MITDLSGMCNTFDAVCMGSPDNIIICKKKKQTN